MTTEITTKKPAITKEQLINALPDKSFRGRVTDDIVDLINSEADSDLRQQFKDNTISYMSVLRVGRIGMAEYVNAVKFVSHRLMGYKVHESWMRTFPERYERLVMQQKTPKEISRHSSAYNKTMAVTKITEQTLVPVHILNMDMHQEAINVQAELMRSARSETVRQKAAECLITQLKAPEVAKVELDVNYSSSTIDDLKATTKALAQQQMQLIQQGHSNALEVAHSEIVSKSVPEEDVIDADYEETPQGVWGN